MKKCSGRIFEIVWAMIMVAVVSSTLTLFLAGRSGGDDAHWVSGEEKEMIEKYRRLEEVRASLMDNYYMELDEEKLILGAVRGMAAAAEDPYTFYYTPEELVASNENSEGIYHGLGMIIQRNDEGYIEIIKVYRDSPAEKAGIRIGDVIVAVNGEAIKGNDDSAYNEAIIKIRGEDGTDVCLSIRRNGDIMDVTATRSKVNITHAEYRMLEDGIGYVMISQFTGDAAEKFAQAIEYFEAQNASGMIIDLRNNPGGLLDQVLEIADSVLPEGVIVYTQDREGKREEFYSDEKMCDIPLVVLVNENSASASELMAAAVKCFDRGTVIGTTTYGKGIVQSLLAFESDGAAIQMTTSSYYAGDGTAIHGTGVIPDVEIALDADHVPIEPDTVSDNQLRKAIEVLSKKS